jgi:RNA polymerase sigma factor (sigma-70 family)
MPALAVQLAPTVNAAAAGDEYAWSELVRHFTPLLRSVARGYRLDQHDVDDVVQACWVALLLSVDSLRDPEAIGAWLITTVRRQALRAHQRHLREVVTDQPLHDRAAGADCLEIEVLKAEQTRILREAVERLPGRQRELLESLIAEPDRSYVEVSRGLDMPIGSIGPTRERGMRRLRQDRRLAEVVAPV